MDKSYFKTTLIPGIRGILSMRRIPQSPIFVDGKGTVGFIPSISEPFCSSCDRIRLTSDARLLTCLFEKSGFELRNLIRKWQPQREIKRQLIETFKKKPQGIMHRTGD